MSSSKPSAVTHYIWAAGLGIAVAVLFVVFEWVVKDGTDYIWNDVVNSDEVRWRVLPLAIILGLVFGWLLKLTKQKRLPPIETDFTASHGAPGPVSLQDLGIIFAVGAVSLLAGASLGPEASLVALCSGFGVWVAGKAGMQDKQQLLLLCGVGALLVAFFGSLVPAVIPLLLLKQSKKLSVERAALIGVSALSTYGAIWLIKGKVHGWGGIPASVHFSLRDYVLAFVLGILTALAATWLHRLIKRFAPITKNIYDRTHWLVTAGIFGGVIGLLYLIGGQTVQFNGSAGSSMLVHNHAEYGTLALAGLVIIKIIATAWSLAAGYRGGLVFPSVYTGVALSLFVGSLADGFGGAGTMIGAIAGIFAALTTPALGLVMLISILPIKLLGLAVAGVIGAALAKKLLSGGAKQPA
jgi:H+/Cl- antiporter ClcA